MHRTKLQNRNCAAQNVNSARAGSKLRVRKTGSITSEYTLKEKNPKTILIIHLFL